MISFGHVATNQLIGHYWLFWYFQTFRQTTIYRQYHILWFLLNMWLPNNSLHIAGVLIFPETSGKLPDTARITYYDFTEHVATNQLIAHCWTFWYFLTFLANYQILPESHTMIFFKHVATNQLIAHCLLFWYFQTFLANYQIPPESHTMISFKHLATNKLSAHCWIFLYFQTFPANYQIPPESHTVIFLNMWLPTNSSHIAGFLLYF